MSSVLGQKGKAKKKLIFSEPSLVPDVHVGSYGATVEDRVDKSLLTEVEQQQLAAWNATQLKILHLRQFDETSKRKNTHFPRLKNR